MLRDRRIRTAQKLDLELPGEEPDRGERERDEAGLRPSCARTLAGKRPSNKQRGNRDQARNGQPADDAKLPVLRPEKCAKAGERDQRAGVSDDLRGGDRAIPTLPSP